MLEESSVFIISLDNIVSNSSQLFIFIRGIEDELVPQELAPLHSIHNTTTGEEIFY